MIDLDELDAVVEHIERRVDSPPFQTLQTQVRKQQRVQRAIFSVAVAGVLLVTGVGALVSFRQPPVETLVTSSDDAPPSETTVVTTEPPKETEPVAVNEQQFFQTLEQSRWLLVEASETFPDRDFTDQAIGFWSLVEPSDRMSFDGGGCFSVDMFLRWDEPGFATVTPNETGLAVGRAELPCDRTPGIANYKPSFGSTVHVELIDDHLLDMRLDDPHGDELWNARFELDR